MSTTDVQLEASPDNCPMPEKYYSEQETVESFKKFFTATQSALLQNHGDKIELMNKLDLLGTSKEQLITMFVTDAVKSYPELEGFSAQEILKVIPSAGPLSDSWYGYQQKIYGIDADINETTAQLKTVIREETSLNKQARKAIKLYDQFANSATSSVPTVTDIAKEVMDEDNMPKGSAPNKMSADDVLDSFDQETRQSLLKQMMKTGVAAYPVPHVPAIMAPTHEEVEQVVADEAPLAVPSNIKIWGVLAGALAVWYIFLAPEKG